MKNLFLLLFVFLIFSCTTDSESVTDCNCDKIVYKYDLISMSGGFPNWGYVEQYTEYEYSNDCNDAKDEYVSIGDNLYYKVICE